MFDAMSVIQSLTPQSSFDHLALQTFKLTHQVVDIYPIISLKRFEHARQDDITGVSGKYFKCSTNEPSDVVPIWRNSSNFEYKPGQMIMMATSHNRQVYVEGLC